MAPNIVDGTLVPTIINEASQAPHVSVPPMKQQTTQVEKTEQVKKETVATDKKEWLIFRKDIKWGNVVMITVLHILGMYGFIVNFPYVQNFRLFLWSE